MDVLFLVFFVLVTNYILVADITTSKKTVYFAILLCIFGVLLLGTWLLKFLMGG